MLNELLKDSEIKPFMKKIKSCDERLYLHSINVAKITEFIVMRMGYSKESAKEVVKGALLHDVGKVFIPDGILNLPRFLSVDEMNCVKNHAVYGYELLKDFPFSEVVTDIVYHHHETENGRGYPFHSTYMERETQIVSIADKYEAMSSKRPYKDALAHADVLVEIEKDCRKITLGTEIFNILVQFPDSLLERKAL